MIDNPGFEPGVFGSVFLASTGATATTFPINYWNSGNGIHPSGFWDGAPYEIVYGPGAGRSGTVSTYTSGTPAVLNLGASGAAVAQDDVILVRRNWAGLSGAASYAAPGENSTASAGTQALRLIQGTATADWNYYMDSEWRDGDTAALKQMVVQGNWRVRFWAKGAVGGDQVRVRFFRENQADFINQTFTLSTSWAQYQTTANIAAGVDDITPPPTGQYRPILGFRLSSMTAGATVYVDDVELASTDHTNPTIFPDRLIQRLQEYQPGVLRDWSGQLGETLDNQLKPPFERCTCGYAPNDSSPGSWNYSLHEFLQLCQHINAEPWYVIPPTFSPSDLTGLCEYLAAPAVAGNTWALRRQALGQTAPWTSVFAKIHLEWGNELWGSGAPGDPFAGASVRGGVRLGSIANDRFAIFKTSPFYSAGPFDLIIGGQAGYAGRQQEIEANSTEHDSTALAPYFGVLNTWANDAEIFEPLLAHPTYESTAGNMFQSKGFLTAGGNGSELSIYEINFHTTSGSSPTAVRNDFVTSQCGGLALPLAMLTYQRDLGANNMCGFSILGFAYQYTTGQYVRVWGMLRDLYGTGRKRPTWLGCECANHAIVGDAITTTHSGDNPSWNQSAINGIGSATTVTRLQSFAFRSGNTYGIVVFNLDLTTQHGVRLNLTATPQANATMWELYNANLHDDNEDNQSVAITQTPITNFQDQFEMVVQPHSMRVITWTQ